MCSSPALNCLSPVQSPFISITKSVYRQHNKHVRLQFRKLFGNPPKITETTEKLFLQKNSLRAWMDLKNCRNTVVRSGAVQNGCLNIRRSSSRKTQQRSAKAHRVLLTFVKFEKPIIFLLSFSSYSIIWCVTNSTHTNNCFVNELYIIPT